MFPSMLPFSTEIIVLPNKRLCGLKLLTVVLPGRLFHGFCWGISMLFDHSMGSAVAVRYGRGGKMTWVLDSLGLIGKVTTLS
jgi:hypothetical protein